MTQRVINGKEYELCYNPDMPAETLIEIRAGRHIVINLNFYLPFSDEGLEEFVLNCILMAIAADEHPSNSVQAFHRFIELRGIVEDEEADDDQESIFDWVDRIIDFVPEKSATVDKSSN